MMVDFETALELGMSHTFTQENSCAKRVCNGKLGFKASGMSLQDSPGETIKSHHPHIPGSKGAAGKNHGRSASAMSIKDMIRSSFGSTSQYHRLQETNLDPEFEASLETIDPRIYPLVAGKSKLPRAPVPVGSKQNLFLKSALYAPRGGLCRMSSKVKKAGLQIASASAKLAHARRSFRRSKTCDGRELGIWMVVNPMFNQPGPDTPDENNSDSCALCGKEDTLDIPLGRSFESWVNTAVFGHNSPCSRLPEDNCSLCRDITRARGHYRTLSLGDMSFWATDCVQDNPNWTSLPVLSKRETKEGCIQYSS